MRQILIAWTIGLVLAFSSTADAADATHNGSVILTVTGKISATNRGAFDGFRDAFLKFREKSFSHAYAFDRAALQQLPQHRISVRAEGWPRSVTATGPSLKDVLDATGASPNASVSLVALDGYTIELSGQDRAARDWILATSTDGTPLGIGDRGPTWLLHDTKSTLATAEDEAKWVWSVFLIEVQ